MKTAVLFLVASFSLALGLKNGLDLVPSMGVQFVALLLVVAGSGS